MDLPRRAISHVLETPITNPQDTACVLAVDRSGKQVHRASMSDSILAISIREGVRREIPTGQKGRDIVGSVSPQPGGTTSTR